MNTHVYNVYNRDTLPSTGSRLNKLGSFTVRHSTGEGYIVLEGGVEKPLKGDTFRKFLDFLKKNKIYDSIPTTALELKNKHNIMLNANTTLESTIPTISVHNILIEREYENANEWEGLPTDKSVKLKRLSFKTLGKDVEVEDVRLSNNSEKVESNGLNNAEDLINAILLAPFELDEVFSEESNIRLLTDNFDRASSKIKLKFNVLENPMDITNDDDYKGKILTGAAGKNIKTRIKEKIDSLKIFSNVVVKNYLKNETITENTIQAKDNSSILNIEATESEGISLMTENGKLVIKHAEIGNRSTNVIPVYGEVRAVSGIETDDMGHVTKVNTKDLAQEISEIYPTKDVAGATYVKKVNLGTETIEGSVEIAKALIVQKDVTIQGSMYTKGQVTALNTKEFTVKDNVFEIGSGNSKVYRYTGMKMNVSKDTGSGTDAADVYIVYDNVDKTFRAMYATEDPLDPNILIPVADAPIKARNFLGNAKYASRFKNELSLQFTGDANGAVKFYGDEGMIDVPISVNKASTSAFGIVRLLESLDEEPVTNDVYSSALLYDKLNKLSEFKLSHEYIPDMTVSSEERSKTIASLMAVYKVYDVLRVFRETYDAAELARQQAALKNRTFVKSGNAAVTFSVTLDDVVTPSITGVGYDNARFDLAAKVGEKFLEFWRATFKMKVVQKTDKLLFTVMEKTPNIEVIYLPVISADKAPFSLTNNFKFEIRRYADTSTSEYDVIGSSLLYNTNKQYIADDVLRFAAAQMKENFYNNLDFSDYTIGSIITNYMLTRNNQTFKIKGQGASAFYKVTSPFKTSGGVLKEKVSARYQKDSTGFSVSLSDIDAASPYIVAIYFKKSDSSVDDTVGLNCTVREYRVDGTYLDKKMGLIDKDTFHTLSNDSWYCYYAYIRPSTGDYVTGDTFGLYNMTGDKNQRLSFANATIGAFSLDGVIHDDANIVRREFHLNKGNKSVIDVITPVFMKRNANWTVSNFVPDNDDDLFLVVSNSSDEDIRYVEYRIPTTNNNALQKQYYSIVCINDGDFNNVTNLKLATGTTFGTQYDSAKPTEALLLENGKTADSKELTVNTNYSNEYSVAMTIKRKTAVKDTVAAHIFFDPKVTVDVMNAYYFIPKYTHAVELVTNNTGVGVANNAIFVYNETGANANKWTYFSPSFEVLRDIPDYTTLLKWYGKRTAGDYIIVQNDPNMFNGMTWYYHNGTTWEAPKYYHPNMFLEHLNLNDESELAQHTTDNVPYKMAIIASVNKYYLWNATSETTGEWVYGGVYYGIFDNKDTVATLDEFNKKYTKVLVPNQTHAQVTINGAKKRFMYINRGGTPSWGLETDCIDYVEYNLKFSIPVAITDAESIKTWYKRPYDGYFAVISTVVMDGQGVYPYNPTDEYYKFVEADGSGTWVKQGIYSQYRPPIADYKYTGEITYAGGSVNHNIAYSYKYVTADLTT